jgi:hypothetical protein
MPGHETGVLRRAGPRDLTLSMTTNSKPGKANKSAARDARLSAALRENLKRRKEQARARVGDKGREEPEQDTILQEAGHPTAPDSPRSEPKT